MAVPALSRVEPVTTSGPTGTVMHTSQVSRSSLRRIGAAEEDRPGAEGLGAAQRGADERRRAARRDADHHVGGGHPALVDGADAGVDRDAALLEPVESNGGAELSAAEFIADLLSDDGEQLLHALADPEELLRDVDDEQFTEIVSLLDLK